MIKELKEAVAAKAAADKEAAKQEDKLRSMYSTASTVAVASASHDVKPSSLESLKLQRLCDDVETRRRDAQRALSQVAERVVRGMSPVLQDYDLVDQLLQVMVSLSG